MATRKTPVSKLSFSDAMAEVESIISKLENEETDVDELSDAVKRAVELIGSCRQRLERTDLEVRELVAGLDTAAGAAADELEHGSGGDAPVES
jgi:exodeoxyribonuclease VII small subunit